MAAETIHTAKTSSTSLEFNSASPMTSMSQCLPSVFPSLAGTWACMTNHLRHEKLHGFADAQHCGLPHVTVAAALIIVLNYSPVLSEATPGSVVFWTPLWC